jgi:hypothetical protein
MNAKTLPRRGLIKKMIFAARAGTGRAAAKLSEAKPKTSFAA